MSLTNSNSLAIVAVLAFIAAVLLLAYPSSSSIRRFIGKSFRKLQEIYGELVVGGKKLLPQGLHQTLWKLYDQGKSLMPNKQHRLIIKPLGEESENLPIDKSETIAYTALVIVEDNPKDTVIDMDCSLQKEEEVEKEDIIGNERPVLEEQIESEESRMRRIRMEAMREKGQGILDQYKEDLANTQAAISEIQELIEIKMATDQDLEDLPLLQQLEGKYAVCVALAEKKMRELVERTGL